MSYIYIYIYRTAEILLQPFLFDVLFYSSNPGRKVDKCTSFSALKLVQIYCLSHPKPSVFGFSV